MSTTVKHCLVLLTIILISILILVCVFLGQFIFISEKHTPQNGIWKCDDLYVLLDAINQRIRIKTGETVQEFHIDIHHDELTFAIYSISMENSNVLDTSLYIYEGTIIQYNDRVHIKSYDNKSKNLLDCWLDKVD